MPVTLTVVMTPFPWLAMIHLRWLYARRTARGVGALGSDAAGLTPPPAPPHPARATPGAVVIRGPGPGRTLVLCGFGAFPCFVIVGREFDRPSGKDTADLYAQSLFALPAPGLVALGVALDDRADERGSRQTLDGTRRGDAHPRADPSCSGVDAAQEGVRHGAETNVTGGAPQGGGRLGNSAFRLTIAIASLLDDVQTHEPSIELENRLQERVSFRLRPSRRVDGQNQKLALSDDSRHRMQKLHPRGQGGGLRNEHGMHRGRNPERHWQPQNRASDYQKRAGRREAPASSEDPGHS